MNVYKREPASQYLARIIAPMRMEGKFRGWTLLEVGKYLADLFEGPLRGEEPKHTNLKDGSKRYHDPYLTRLANLSWRFMKLSDRDRSVVEARARTGFHWRGEDMEMFHQLYDDYLNMKELGIEYFKNETRRKLGIMIQDQRYP